MIETLGEALNHGWRLARLLREARRRTRRSLTEKKRLKKEQTGWIPEPMNEQDPEQIAEWTVGLNKAGLVSTLVHASTLKAYLSAKGQKTHLTLTARQAKSLGADLVDASSG